MRVRMGTIVAMKSQRAGATSRPDSRLLIEGNPHLPHAEAPAPETWKLKAKSVIRYSLILLAAAALIATTRVSTRHPTHEYPAPDFTLHDMNGASVRLSDFRGKAVVLNFWATWCPPCRREIPWFIEMQKKYGPQGLQVVGVSMDDGGRDAIEAFVKKMGINYPILQGDDHAAGLYGGAEVLPTTYYISRDGLVVSSVNGLISEGEVESNIQEALRNSPTKSTGLIASTDRTRTQP